MSSETSRAVLVIDDEPLIRWAVSEALSRAGHETVTASDGAGGLRTVATASRAFDVIFLDFRLPDSNDFQLLTAIRSWTPRSTVVLMTAAPSPDFVTEAQRLGVHRMLNKPFDIADVQNIVAASAAISGTKTGDCHGSHRYQRISIPVPLDSTRDRGTAGTVDLRDLSALG